MCSYSRMAAGLVALTMGASTVLAAGCTNAVDTCFSKVADTEIRDCTLSPMIWDIWPVKNTQNTLSLDGCIHGAGVNMNADITHKPGNEYYEFLQDPKTFDVKDDTKLYLTSFHPTKLTVGNRVVFEGGEASVLTQYQEGGFGCHEGELTVGQESTITAELGWFPTAAYFGEGTTASFGRVRWQLSLPEPAGDLFGKLVVGERGSVEIGQFIGGYWPLNENGTPQRIQWDFQDTRITGLRIDVGKDGRLVITDPIDIKAGWLNVGDHGIATLLHDQQHSSLTLDNNGVMSLGKGAKVEVPKVDMCGGTVTLAEGAVVIVAKELMLCGNSTITGPGEIHVGGDITYHHSDDYSDDNVLTVTDGARLYGKSVTVAISVENNASLFSDGDFSMTPVNTKILRGGTVSINGNLDMTALVQNDILSLGTTRI